ncbi:hypothetical protein BX666DRAFT_350948 [Dichotomocladium elegans]|nr:hypothetical protein BX666DRAFT_350948 [Dichotomocladium elegans]
MPANHNKKTSERRDSLKQQQQQQQHSSSSSKPNPHTNHRANTPSSTATGFNTPASSSNVPSTYPLHLTPQAGSATTAGSNGFNASAVTQFLNKRFSDTFAAYHDDSNPETRPKKHESQEKAWGNKGGLPSK